MSHVNKLVVVSGATGNQGGAVARELLAQGFKVRALTRKPDGDAAKALATLGAEIVQGDLDDAASLQGALRGAWGAWAVQNTWEAGVEKEEQQGKAFAKLAKECGIQHYVYTSVGSAHRATGIPHFDNKWRVEETVRALAFPSFAILRPVFFMENLTSAWFLQGDKIVSALAPTTKLQMIAVSDIGKMGASLFVDHAKWNGKAVDVAGDARTMSEVCATLSKHLGRTIEYQQIPMDAVRQNSEDFALMLEWFERVGYDADIAAMKSQFGFEPLTLDAWAKAHAAR